MSSISADETAGRWGCLRRCGDAEMFQRFFGSGGVVLDAEHVAVAAFVLPGPDDVVAAPASALAGEEAAEGERVGQFAGVGGDELAVPPVDGDAVEVVGFGVGA